VSAGALEALDRILDGGGDADDVLRAVVGVLVREPGVRWAGVSFREQGRLVLGPEAGTPEPGRRLRLPVVYRGDEVGELAVDGEAEEAFLRRVAALISAYVLLGWDTGGEAWDP
jgi:hypothetical protein